MGEIKSTLDLVMARTEHLKLSDADRLAQSRRKFGARIRGLLQQLSDQALRFEEFERRLADLGAEFDLDFHAPLVDALLQLIVPGEDNAMALALLENPGGCDTSAVRLVLSRYQEKRDAVRSDHSARLKQDLADNREITGRAVHPNLDRDEQWIATARDLMDHFNGLLEQEKEKISNTLNQ